MPHRLQPVSRRKGLYPTSDATIHGDHSVFEEQTKTSAASLIRKNYGYQRGSGSSFFWTLKSYVGLGLRVTSHSSPATLGHCVPLVGGIPTNQLPVNTVYVAPAQSLTRPVWPSGGGASASISRQGIVVRICYDTWFIFSKRGVLREDRSRKQELRLIYAARQRRMRQRRYQPSSRHILPNCNETDVAIAFHVHEEIVIRILPICCVVRRYSRQSIR